MLPNACVRLQYSCDPCCRLLSTYCMLLLINSKNSLQHKQASAVSVHRALFPRARHSCTMLCCVLSLPRVCVMVFLCVAVWPVSWQHRAACLCCSRCPFCAVQTSTHIRRNSLCCDWQQGQSNGAGGHKCCLMLPPAVCELGVVQTAIIISQLGFACINMTFIGQQLVETFSWPVSGVISAWVDDYSQSSSGLFTAWRPTVLASLTSSVLIHSCKRTESGLWRQAITFLLRTW